MQASVRHRLLSDGGREVLSAYRALVTDEKSPMRGYAKRAYFVIDREGRRPLRENQREPAGSPRAR